MKNVKSMMNFVSACLVLLSEVTCFISQYVNGLKNILCHAKSLPDSYFTYFLCFFFAENIPIRSTPKISTHAIERPHATISMLQRQGSFRGLSHLNSASPFKRQLSLRISDLPSNLERTRSHNVDYKLDQRKQSSQFLHLKTPGE